MFAQSDQNRFGPLALTAGRWTPQQPHILEATVLIEIPKLNSRSHAQDTLREKGHFNHVDWFSSPSRDIESSSDSGNVCFFDGKNIIQTSQKQPSFREIPLGWGKENGGKKSRGRSLINEFSPHRKICLSQRLSPSGRHKHTTERNRRRPLSDIVSFTSLEMEITLGKQLCVCNKKKLFVSAEVSGMVPTPRQMYLGMSKSGRWRWTRWTYVCVSGGNGKATV